MHQPRVHIEDVDWTTPAVILCFSRYVTSYASAINALVDVTLVIQQLPRARHFLR